MLKVACNLTWDVSPPLWLDGRADPSPTMLISFPNGLLDYRAQRFLPASPQLFTAHACGFDYAADAPEPARWLQFVDEIFDGEQEQIDTLQEVFGYCLTADNPLQKMFLITGPTRGGKGTIARVIRGLLAEGAVCGPTMASIGETFGLQQMLGVS